MRALHQGRSNRTIQPQAYKEATVYLTAKTTAHLLAELEHRAFEPLNQPDENYPTIMIVGDYP